MSKQVHLHILPILLLALGIGVGTGLWAITEGSTQREAIVTHALTARALAIKSHGLGLATVSFEAAQQPIAKSVPPSNVSIAQQTSQLAILDLNINQAVHLSN